jgi:hypothetical protein
MSYEPILYPAWRYHRELPPRIVQTPDEAAALGPGWADTPAAILDPAPVSDAPVEAPPALEREREADAPVGDAPPVRAKRKR